MERDSSDDEDDHQNLIEQNDRKDECLDHRRRDTHHDLPDQLPTATACPRSTLHIDDIERTIRRRFKFNLNKRHLLWIFVLLSILIVFLSTDARSLFSKDLSAFRFESLSDRVKESELRALYLLRQQQLSLFSLWNQTSVHGAVNDTNSNSSVAFNSSTFKTSSLVEDIKPALVRQISLNREIQQVLLSPHRTGNNSNTGEVPDDPTSYLSYDSCRKVDQKLSERKTIEWKPNPNKFLFAICLSGQMSNHLICLEKHMFFAALLNRVLVIPSHKFDYQYDRVLDIEHINTCLGREVVVTFEEFEKRKKNHPHIDRFICYFSFPEHCYVDEDHVKKLKHLGVSMGGKLESPWVEDVKKPSKRTVEEVKAKFDSNEAVIAIGDVFFADVESDWVMQPGGPIAHKCRTLIEPSRLILLTAQRFVQTFLGQNYIALHFRRHGFLKFCNAKKPSCFYPIPQASECINRLVARAGVPVIYLSTDAAESETSLLQSLVVVDGKTIPLVKRPSRNSAEKWDALLYRHGLEGDSQVEAMLDKSISAMSNVFIGASGSTFTEDILRLRRGWGTASVCDGYLCQGEEPNFIAENE